MRAHSIGPTWRWTQRVSRNSLPRLPSIRRLKRSITSDPTATAMRARAFALFPFADVGTIIRSAWGCTSATVIRAACENRAPVAASTSTRAPKSGSVA